MSFNRSDVMALLWVTLSFLTLVSAPETSTSTANPAYIEDENTKKILHCMIVLKKFCGKSQKIYVSSEDCLKEGVTDYPVEPYAPDFVEEYFEKFRTYINPDKFQLPDKYCEDLTREELDRLQCPSELYERNLEADKQYCINNLSLFTKKLDPESEEKSRLNILFFMLYDTARWLNLGSPRSSTSDTSETSEQEEENHEITEEHLLEGSPVYECLMTLKNYCNVSEDEYVSSKDCLQAGVTNYQHGPNTPNFVVEYFEKFRTHLDPGNFLVPDKYCENEAREELKYGEYLEEDFEIYLKEGKDYCMDKLDVFKDKIDAESEEQSRYNILYYMLYDTSIYLHDLYEIDDYFSHACETVEVKPGMLDPLDYCVKKHSETDG